MADQSEVQKPTATNEDAALAEEAWYEQQGLVSPMAAAGTTRVAGQIVVGAAKQVAEHPLATAGEIVAGAGVAAAGTYFGVTATAAAAIAAVPTAGYGLYKVIDIAGKEGVGAIPDHLKRFYDEAAQTINSKVQAMQTVFTGDETDPKLQAAKKEVQGIGAATVPLGAGLIGGSPANGELGAQGIRIAAGIMKTTAEDIARATLPIMEPVPVLVTGTMHIANEVSSITAQETAMLSQGNDTPASSSSTRARTSADPEDIKRLMNSPSMEAVPVHERQVLELRYDENGRVKATLDEVAQALHTKLSTVSSREQRALERLGNPEFTAHTTEIKSLINNPGMEALLARERQVLELRYDENGRVKATLDEVAQALHTKLSTVSYRERRALEKLRNPEFTAHTTEIKTLMNSPGMEALPARQRQVLELRYDENGRVKATPAKVAEELGIDPSVVYSRERSALKNLRDPQFVEHVEAKAQARTQAKAEHEQAAERSRRSAAARRSAVARDERALLFSVSSRVEALSKRQQDIIKARYHPDGTIKQRSQAKVALDLGISLSTLKSAESNALYNMRHIDIAGGTFAMQLERKALLENNLRRKLLLTPQENEVLTERFGQHGIVVKPRVDIARPRGLTTSQVEDIEKRALNKLRRGFK